ncbi:acyltransferase family protein [Amycolatopsis australiensis]|uniref:Peptidoglycan/LPS O-acetylase OafA/YrhL, contains acyltransferase and SGNH-hydrolase domains n=1 Tax=Amycolatopsis australiensis TaxID=546364 RepID=A0A1K1RL05_9PSEU|nr:acyltransferase [Amycolatopsis australiensis]SFW72524.1 Peptidoglycan/LPS O-acetylase OafA/YrhL, contains acyltransferase and SGNH-hydrolase domains [Amycolatopsis australiensis]
MTEPRAGAFSRLPSLTGMRFLAAFLVFACHACLLGYFTETTAAHFTNFAYSAGWIGVEFFFLLSGFVLTWSAVDGEPKRHFWRRRFFKIYPNYLVVWVAALLLSLWAGMFTGFSDILPSLFVVHSWSPDIQVIVSNNPVTWSLACEALFYLLFPFLYRGIKRIPANGLWWAVGAVTAAIVALPAISTLLPSAEAMPGMDFSVTQNWFLEWFPPARCLDFVLGILMVRVVREKRWIGLRILPSLGIVALGVVLQQIVFPTAYSLEATVALPLALLITSVAVADASGRRSVFRARWLVWLGVVSYAFYLVHFLVLSYGHVVLGATESWSLPAALGILAGVLAVVVLVAWALTRLVEEPVMRRWARRKVRPVVAVPEEPLVSVPESIN